MNAKVKMKNEKMGGRRRTMQRLMWVVTVVAFAGAAMNVLEWRAGFAVWICTNSASAYYNWWIGEKALAVQFAAYIGLSIWGWIAWGK